MRATVLWVMDHVIRKLKHMILDGYEQGMKEWFPNPLIPVLIIDRVMASTLADQGLAWIFTMTESFVFIAIDDLVHTLSTELGASFHEPFVANTE